MRKRKSIASLVLLKAVKRVAKASSATIDIESRAVKIKQPDSRIALREQCPHMSKSIVRML
jgi:hypothetical protein